MLLIVINTYNIIFRYNVMKTHTNKNNKNF